MQQIALSPVPNQNFQATLGGQASTIVLWTRSTGLFLDLYLGTSLVIGGVLALNNVLIVRQTYLGFAGDLAFYDTQGTTDPVYTAFGTRYVLRYFSPADLATFGVIA